MNEARKRGESKKFVTGSYPEPPRHSWDRQPGEGNLPWEAFVIYREMGAERSARKVAMRLGKAPTHTLKYSSVFNWKERVADYERHLDHVAQAEREEAIREMARKHTMAAEFLWRKALQVIQATDIADISVRDAIAMFRAALPAERQSRLADQAHVPQMHIGELYDGVMDDDLPAPPQTGPDGQLC